MKKIAFCILMTVAALFAGCNDDETAAILRVENTTASLSAEGGEGIIKITASPKVTAVSEKAWITINQSDVSATEIRFTVTKNTGLMSRTAQITIKDGGLTETVNITQFGAVFALGTNEITLGPNPEETRLAFSVNNSELPQISVAHPWLKVTIDGGELVLLPEVNIGLERVTSVTLTTSWKSVELLVTQDNIKFMKESSVEMYRSGRGAQAAVSGNDYLAGSTGWSTATSAFWITATPDYTNNQLLISLQENTTGSIRSGYVDIVVEGVTVDRVTLTQEVFSYDYFLGEWKLNYYWGPLTIKLEEDVLNESYVWKYNYTDATGDYEFNITVGYWLTGNLSIDSQFVGTYQGNQTYIYAMDLLTNGGIFFLATFTGFDLVFNRSESSPGFTIQDSGAYASFGYVFDSLIFACFTGEPSESTYVTDLYDWFPLLESLTK